MGPLEATLKGTSEIGFTVVSLTVSLIAVFIPLLLMSGMVGRLFREFSVTVSVSLVISAVVSLTLTPMMCALMVKGHDAPGAGPGAPSRALERGFDALQDGYRRSLEACMRHRGAVTLSFNLAPGAALGDAVAALDAAQARLGLPLTVTTGFQGTAQTFQSSLGTQPDLIAAAVVAVSIVLGVLCESLLLPITILSTLPSAGLGALVALDATGAQLDVMSLVGIILLIGIVKKNAIMMVDFARTAEAEGMSPRDALAPDRDRSGDEPLKAE